MGEKKRIMLTVAYDGTRYCGWQRQSNGTSVEEALTKALRKMTGEDITLIGASRTDSGVHALGNVAVFDTESSIPPERMAMAVARWLPRDIAVRASKQVPPYFHPRRRDCVKTYEYRVINARFPVPTLLRTHYFVSFKLDIGKMRDAAAYLVGKHDFTSFCNIRTDADSPVRTVRSIDIIREGEEITFRVRGDGFLYNMIRIMVGTLLRVGRGFYEPADVKSILEAKDRDKAGPTAPPQGLTLIGIEYV